MPAKRSTNAAKGRASGKKPTRGQAKPAAGALALGTAQSDILGVVLAVVAVAMLVSVVVPSSAVVTSAVHDFLALSFGAGAPLVPVALFAFAMTFFFDGEGPVSGRIAAGIALVLLAVLAMLSLNFPGAAEDPALVLDPASAEQAGGYVGGALAFALLTLLYRIKNRSK